MLKGAGRGPELSLYFVFRERAVEREGLFAILFFQYICFLVSAFEEEKGNSPRGSSEVSRLMAENAGVLAGVPSFSSLTPDAPDAALHQYDK